MLIAAVRDTQSKWSLCAQCAFGVQGVEHACPKQLHILDSPRYSALSVWLSSARATFREWSIPHTAKQLVDQRLRLPDGTVPNTLQSYLTPFTAAANCCQHLHRRRTSSRCRTCQHTLMMQILFWYASLVRSRWDGGQRLIPRTCICTIVESQILQKQPTGVRAQSLMC